MRRQIDLEDFEDTVNFKFTVESGDGHKTTASNTDQFKMKDISIETMIRNSNKEDMGIQIDANIIYKQSRQEQLEKSPKKSENQENDGNDDQQQNEQYGSEETIKKVIKFMRKISPLMEEEMKENFPLYQKLGIDDQPKFFKRESRLAVTLENLQHGMEDSLQVSDISWNATGVIIAAAYAKPEHSGACSHKSMICLWGLYKRNFKPTRPDVISTPNCINCISFHPKKPSVFACGSYTGEILLYDYSKTEEQLLAKTVVDDYYHRDLVSQINWWPFRPPGKPDTNYNVLSLGTDGKILLWEIPNHSINQQSTAQRLKMIFRYPVKGFLMLRKKQGAVVPVSGLAMNQSKINRNIFVVGSQGGSILRATLNPINHYINHQSKALLDLQPNIKFKPSVYPFLLNILPKHLPEIKNHLEKYCAAHKIKQIESVIQIFGTHPEIRSLYPNPITYAYEPMAFPISSISDNKHGLFIANAYEGYSRVYLENSKVSIEAIQEGYEWAWLQGSHLMGGFLGQEWSVVDWTTGTILWSAVVGQGLLWKEFGNQVGVVCQKTKVKIIQLGDKLLGPFNESKTKEVNKKIEQLRVQ